MAKELIRDLKKVVENAVISAFEDKYVMDFECEGVEPNEVAEKRGGNEIHTDANVWMSMMWSTGARPSNKKARSYIDTAIESAEENAIEEYPDDEDMQTEYIFQDLDGDYAPYVSVVATPEYFTNKNGFQICDLTIQMTLVNYLGSKISEYEPKTICFSTVSMQENINKNYVEEDDFEFEHGGYPVEQEVIEEFIYKTIARYVAEF